MTGVSDAEDRTDAEDRMAQKPMGEGASGASSTGPGDRRLDRPPSDRYRRAASDGVPGTAGAGTAGAVATPGTPVRGLAFGTLVGVVGVAIIVALGGALAISAGLLVVAVVIGYAVALATKAGAGATLPRSRRVWVVVTLAVGAVALGQVGLWLYARGEGGVLGLPDYLSTVYGVLVPLQLVAAALAGWWTAR